MARTTPILYKGKVENLIFYEREGVSFVRKSPFRVRQTRATKASAKRFGIAASMSAVLRKGLADSVQELRDWKFKYPLQTVLMHWLKEKESGQRQHSLTSLDGFSFNPSHALYSRLSKGVSVQRSKTGAILIRIPALTPSEDLQAPPRTKFVNWTIAAASCTIQNPSVARQQAGTDFDMPYKDEPLPSRQIEFPIEVKSGELALVVIGLKYQVENKGRISAMTDRRWLPLDVVGYVS